LPKGYAAVLPGGFEGIGLGAIGVPGGSSPNGQRTFSADWNIVEPGYFATLRMPLLAGRDFNDADRQGTPLKLKSHRSSTYATLISVKEYQDRERQ
jgi:hypothetical protein